MDSNQLYDPPLTGTSASRGRSSSFSATGAAPRVFQANTARRQSFSAGTGATRPVISRGLLSDDEPQYRTPPIELTPNPLHSRGPSLSGPSKQDPSDASADRALWRDGRQSKQLMLQDDPKLQMTGDFEQFMAQLYDLTHSIDAVENDVDEIVELRNKIVSLDPKVDVGQVSLKADLDALAALTTQTGRGIVAIEDWLLGLHDWSKKVKALVKSGQAGETLEEVGEIKYHIANAKMDFAEAMERIREGAQQEAFRRERTRIWMARHIRHREPDVEDGNVRGLLKAAELGAADGIEECPVTSYAGLFALQNPFTELAELTNGMAFLGDDLDTEIVNAATGKDRKKRVIYLDKASQDKLAKSASSSKRTSNKKKSSSRSKSAPAPTPTWFGSRYNFLSSLRDAHAKAVAAHANDERKFRYIQAEQFAAEKDLEYGFARQTQLSRVNRRKKIIIALLLVVILALILFIVLATMPIPKGKLDVPFISGGVDASADSQTQAVGATSPSAQTSSPIASIQSESDAKVPILTISEIDTGSQMSAAAGETVQSIMSSAESGVASFLSGLATAAAPDSATATSVQTSSVSTMTSTANSGMWVPPTAANAGAQQTPTQIQGVPLATILPGVQQPGAPQPAPTPQQPTVWWAGPAA
ncbi:hypothetical protein JCM10908_001486 [Rhodotorula pacifica]|uniref:uncharacterized protein n=1 Tax=Rhodotorula pacifica TaxID=1495444 RepID=UPI003177E472